MASVAYQFYDMMLTFAFGFHQEDSDIKSSERLLKGAKKQLSEKVCE